MDERPEKERVQSVWGALLDVEVGESEKPVAVISAMGGWGGFAVVARRVVAAGEELDEGLGGDVGEDGGGGAARVDVEFDVGAVV